MEARFIQATPERISDVLQLMEEFYAVEHLPYNETIARKGLEQLLHEPHFGLVHFVEVEQQVAGYIVLTFGFSLEFHGRDALVDELYVREAWRGRGLAKAALQFVEGICRELDIAALHLEVDHVNKPAQELYRKSGYKDHDRFLLTKWIQPLAFSAPRTDAGD